MATTTKTNSIVVVNGVDDNVVLVLFFLGFVRSIVSGVFEKRKRLYAALFLTFFL